MSSSAVAVQPIQFWHKLITASWHKCELTTSRGNFRKFTEILWQFSINLRRGPWTAKKVIPKFMTIATHPLLKKDRNHKHASTRTGHARWLGRWKSASSNKLRLITVNFFSWFHSFSCFFRVFVFSCRRANMVVIWQTSAKLRHNTDRTAPVTVGNICVIDDNANKQQYNQAKKRKTKTNRKIIR